ncbi:MAG: 4-(cytidine 5'-diphospho)-2-C-methyl-D-erythritol kinase [Proteobacteria bacterium]|nr:4-(cytidine 5'-diphospho)-2-C-methyl-D-erythritol kinase [Pseudomonadota bacterium]
MNQKKSLTVFAPAKINLYLHVTGWRDDGYHSLDSLAVFADVGDKIRIETAADFSFLIKGPYASSFDAAGRDASPDSANLAVRAAWAVARAVRKDLRVRLTLEKNLPPASGIGGGSADAAAVIWGLMEWWDYTPQGAVFLPDATAALGADVPVCFACRPTVMRGIGDMLEPAPDMAEIPAVLVNPGRLCPTAEVFRKFDGDFRANATVPEALDGFENLLDFLVEQENSLTPAAVAAVPEIAFILEDMEAQAGCHLARMSGSGATCFGLFRESVEAQAAAEAVALNHPEWWVRAVTLNRVERY